jgi:ribosomal protein S25
MNSTNKELIFEELKKNYDYVSSIYEEDAILGIFIYGEKTPSIKVVVIPSLEELCFGKIGGLIHKDNNTIIIEDICTFASSYEFYKMISTDLVIFNPIYLDLITSFIQNKKNEDIKEVKTGVLEVIKRRIENDKNIQLDLTFSEKNALEEIYKKVGKEGIISINTLSKTTGISRPVFNNLLNKLENTNSAIVKNMGAKGTYIKIINQKII